MTIMINNNFTSPLKVAAVRNIGFNE